MLRPDLNRWSLNQESLTELCLHAPHPRTRERLLALGDIARGSCASALCKPLGRHLTTVLQWVHNFNERGPQALIFMLADVPIRRILNQRRGKMEAS